jgi:hypothetical protein
VGVIAVIEEGEMMFLLSLVVTTIALAVGFVWGYRKKEAELVEGPSPTWVPYWTVNIHEYVTAQMAWSRRVFGPPKFTDPERLCRHIEKELGEIRKHPTDCEEWIDVVILAFEGAWRAGHSPLTIARTLQDKQEKNLARKWVIPTDPTTPIEHDRRYDERETNP